MPEEPKVNEQEVTLGITSATGPVSSMSPSISKLSIRSGASPAEIVEVLLSTAQDQLLPWEDHYLPSRGMYYDGRVPEGKIKIRPMNIAVDKIFATGRFTQTGQALDHVFKVCVKFPDETFDSLDLLNGDRVYLLFALRGITHGNIYEFLFTCPNEDCTKSSIQEYDLNKLQGNIKYPKYPKEPVRVVLPYLSELTNREVWVELRYLRGRDNRIIEKNQRARQRITGVKADQLDDSIEANLNLAIVNINGVLDRMKIEKLIKQMHSRDTATIRQFLTETSPGIDISIDITCPECNQSVKTDLPMTESFFRPKNPKGV
jgi:hypothetical protein